MSASALEQLKSQAAALSPPERADLAHFLIHSLDQAEDDDVQTAWDAELARRLADIESGKVTGTPAAEVFAQLREKYS